MTKPPIVCQAAPPVLTTLACAALCTVLAVDAADAAILRIGFATNITMASGNGADSLFTNEFGLAGLQNVPLTGYLDIDLAIAPTTAGPTQPNYYTIAGASVTLGNKTLNILANPNPAVTGGASESVTDTNGGFDELSASGGPSAGWIVARPASEIPVAPSSAYDFLFDWKVGTFFTGSSFALSELNLNIREFNLIDTKDLASAHFTHTPGFPYSLSTVDIQIASVANGGTFGTAAKYSGSNRGMNNGFTVITGTTLADPPPAPIPAPSVLALLGLGLGVLVRQRRSTPAGANAGAR